MQLLASVPSGALVDLVLDGGEIRYRRAVCARALVGRVPDEHATALADCGCDETVPLDVRNPILRSVLSMPDQPRSDDLLASLSVRLRGDMGTN
ncbi:hypothetical protein [Spirillospora sp. NPDC048819]|uniref:hypothetical protein n=1 Tax=Spirillospora sp. NPDC048819 TaxID=3155268 RepID=UPI0034058EF9